MQMRSKDCDAPLTVFNISYKISVIYSIYYIWKDKN